VSRSTTVRSRIIFAVSLSFWDQIQKTFENINHTHLKSNFIIIMTELTVAFSHVHMYVDRVEEFEVYKELEIILNDHSMDHATVSIANDKNDESFLPQNRDIIRQLMAGLGFRVTAFRSFPTSSTNTKTMLVTSPDPNGVQFVVSSLDPQSNVPVDDFHHFDAGKMMMVCICTGRFDDNRKR
jgi:hypothetical protein